MKYYLYRKSHHPVVRLWVAGVMTCLLAVGTAGVAIWRAQQTPLTTTETVSAAKVATPPIESRMLIVGDVFWARQIQAKAQSSGLNYTYPTHGLTAADRSAYDAWIANFECPITTRDVPYEQQVRLLRFNCRPEYLPELSKWFTAVTLANNHMDNNGGLEGLQETRANLGRNSIQYTGSYDMSTTGDICEVIALPARLGSSKRTVTVPVALCGYMYVVNTPPTDEQLAVMQAYAKVMPVIAMPHMGVEYRPTAEPAKESAYRRMVDSGADVVVGAHPHVIQNSENYKGRLIAYSVGNFLFDQQSLGRETTLGLGVAIHLTIPSGTAAKVYQQIGSKCSAFKDDCLAQLQAKLTTRPKIAVDYEFVCYDEASGVPKLGETSVCDAARKTATVDQLSDLSKQW